jgi:hypothetical protein
MGGDVVVKVMSGGVLERVLGREVVMEVTGDSESDGWWSVGEIAGVMTAGGARPRAANSLFPHCDSLFPRCDKKRARNIPFQPPQHGKSGNDHGNWWRWDR